MSNQARNLLLLAASAFSQKKFDEAGTLFAASLSSDDAADFLTELAAAEEPELAEASADSKAKRTPISRIAASIATSMAAEASDEEDESDDEDEEDNEESEEADDDEDDESDGDEDEPGSSISAASDKPNKKSRILISMATSSPVRMKK